mmetsp:Transcript_15895/g.30338  ORF Transcript_15895/g.30338 Transcript_15895/m.30338 type:complete len:106 (-) Transcript_15895:573-890(-)
MAPVHDDSLGPDGVEILSVARAQKGGVVGGDVDSDHGEGADNAVVGTYYCAGWRLAETNSDRECPCPCRLPRVRSKARSKGCDHDDVEEYDTENIPLARKEERSD